MPMIPKRIHKIVEWHLRNANCIRANAFMEAEKLREMARAQSPQPEVSIKGKGGHGDRVARAAQLMAEGLSRKDAVKQTAKELDLPKNVVYDIALQEQ